MKHQDVEKSLEKLNYEYLKERMFIETSNTHSFKYKLEKSYEIIKYLGWSTFFKFKKNKLNNSLNHKIEIDYSKIKSKNQKIVVYTCIFGNIDSILEPLYYDELIDYKIITDQEISKDSHWEKISIDDFSFLKDLDNKMKNRYVKLFPNKFFKEYEYSIYIDGNILVVSNFRKFLSVIEEKTIGIFNHPNRNDLEQEAAAIIYLDNADGRSVKKQVNTYKKEGFPSEFGLFENSLIIRKHHDESTINLMTKWWEQLNSFTYRDQLSLMYSLWKLGLKPEFIQVLGPNIDDNALLRRIKHKSK